MTDAVFRRAAAADVPAIVKLLGDDVLGRTREDVRDPPNPRYAAAFAAIDADSNQLLAVAEHDGTVVGCLQISFVPGLSKIGMWRGQIEHLARVRGEPRRHEARTEMTVLDLVFRHEMLYTSCPFRQKRSTGL